MNTAVHSNKRHPAHIRRSASDRWAKIITYVIVGLFGLMCLYPLLLTVTVSLIFQCRKAIFHRISMRS